MKSLKCRNGFTLIELLVVIGVIAILVALILPAVNAAREASRRTTCVANLRQVGVALSSYHEAHGLFPPAVVYAYPGVVDLAPPGVRDHSQDVGWEADGFRSNWILNLLPHFDQIQLFDQWNFSTPPSSPMNQTSRAVRIAVLTCPSDGGSSEFYLPGDSPWARSNHAINGGPDPFCMQSERFERINCVAQGCPECVGAVAEPDDPRTVAVLYGSGVAGINRSFRIADIARGTGKTIAVEEVLAGAAATDRRGVWALPTIGSSMTYGHGGHGGAMPFPGGGPNSEQPDLLQDCRSRASAGLPCRPNFVSSRASARSRHPGLVNALLAEGSVRSFENSIDLSVWANLHNRHVHDVQAFE